MRLDHNTGYGFDPHDDSDYLVIENNNVHHNGTHGTSPRSADNNITFGTTPPGIMAATGIMLHRYCDDGLIENTAASTTAIRHRPLRQLPHRGPGQYVPLQLHAGIRCSVGASDNLIISNDRLRGQLRTLSVQGIDAPKLGGRRHCKRNQYVNNLVHHNGGQWHLPDQSDDNAFIRKRVSNANYGPVVVHQPDSAIAVDGNSIGRDVVIRTQGNPSFSPPPSSATSLLRWCRWTPTAPPR